MRVTRPSGINRIILLCDDANLMPVYKQEALLEHNLELFSSRRVQFLFSAGIYPWEAKPYQPNSFETSFELKGFSDKDHIFELISKINTSSVEFSQEAIDLLFEVFCGHPRFTLSACQNAYEYIMRSLEKSITAKIIHRVCEEMRIRRDEDEQRIKESRNFK